MFGRQRILRMVMAFAAMGLAWPAAAEPEETEAGGVVPEQAVVHSEDARRFAAVFAASDGSPTAEQLQQGYLDGAGRGVEVFTPYRIVDAATLARAIAADPEKYRRAIDICLPAAEAATADLRAIYTRLHALFPDRPLPEIYVVFGAGNSGGTAAADAQVIGLEVICELAPDIEAARAKLRELFAHETVHSLQPEPSDQVYMADPLLVSALIEGMAEHVATLVTGISPTKNDWAATQTDWLWGAFEADRLLYRDAVAASGSLGKVSPEAETAFRRWFGNYKLAPAGWPEEMGYWIGATIIQSYVAHSDDRDAALNRALRLTSPETVAEILAGSDYAKWVAIAHPEPSEKTVP